MSEMQKFAQNLATTAPGTKGLTLELSRPAQGEPVFPGATKRARLERTVRPLTLEVRNLQALEFSVPYVQTSNSDTWSRGFLLLRRNAKDRRQRRSLYREI